MISRPVLRVQGGKFRAWRWLLNFFPAHERYVEPFGGAATMLLQKPRSMAEVYNDLDDQLVGVFRVLRDREKSAELYRRLLLTPYSRAEFEASFEPPQDEIDAARLTIVRSFMGHGNDAITRRCRAGFRTKLVDAGVLPATDWSEYADAIAAFTDRLQGVLIERNDALWIIDRLDSSETLFFVDPPPVPLIEADERDQSHGLRYPMDVQAHRDLATVIHGVRGMVILTGQPCDLFEELYGDWESYGTEHVSDGARKTDGVWLNPASVDRLRGGPRPGRELFEAVA